MVRYAPLEVMLRATGERIRIHHKSRKPPEHQTKKEKIAIHLGTMEVFIYSWLCRNDETMVRQKNALHDSILPLRYRALSRCSCSVFGEDPRLLMKYGGFEKSGAVQGLSKSHNG